MPFDTAHLHAVGIDPARERLITMKCGSNWSAGFGDLAAGRRPVHVANPDVLAVPHRRAVVSSPLWDG